jgi:hypothetical protein
MVVENGGSRLSIDLAFPRVFVKVLSNVLKRHVLILQSCYIFLMIFHILLKMNNLKVIFAIIVLKLGYFPLYNIKPSIGTEIAH